MTKTQIKDLLKKAANRRKGIGAIPVGLRFTIAGVKMFVEAQFDIYNKVHINIIDEKTKKTIVKVDGVVRNKKDQAEKLLKYVAKNAELEDSSLTLYLKNTKKIIDQLSLEVNLYNNPKKATTTKRTVKRTTRVSPARKGFVYRKTSEGIIEIPKNATTSLKINELPNYEFFVTKDEGNKFLVIETTSGFSMGGAFNKKDAIEQAKESVKNSLLKDKNFIKNEIRKKRLPEEYIKKLNFFKTPTKTKAMPIKRTASKPAAKKAAKPPTNKPAAKRTKAKKTYVKLKQTGVSKSKKLDAKRTALKPGKRVSAKGNTYYEYRANRSDLKPRKKGEGESL